MKVLLINPPFTIYGGLKGHGGKSPPLNLAYIVAYIRQKPNVIVEILDAEALELTYDDILKKVISALPDIVAFTVPTTTLNHVEEIIKRIKNCDRNITTVLGGPHPTVFPKEVLKNEDVDFVVIGEGEITFSELIDHIRDPINKKREDINGIGYRIKKEIVINRPREFIKNLDELPFPARDLLPGDLYQPPPTKRVSNKKTTSIIGSRGCPYNCTYCIAKIIWGRKYRARSPKNIVDEIEECVNKYGLAEFNFHDELFVTNKERIKELCKEIKQRNLDIAFVCMARVDSVNKEILVYMKEAGCKKIMYGVENANQTVLKLMNKRQNVEQVIRAVKLTKKAGIKVAVNFMFGNIGETEESIKESLQLAKKLNADTTAFLIACPYPGTEFYDTAKANRYFRENYDWKDFVLVGENTPLLNLPGLPAERIKYWQRRAYREYYLRPRYILMKLFGIRTKQDILNLFEGFKLFWRVA